MLTSECIMHWHGVTLTPPSPRENYQHQGAALLGIEPNSLYLEPADGTHVLTITASRMLKLPIQKT